MGPGRSGVFAVITDGAVIGFDDEENDITVVINTFNLIVGVIGVAALVIVIFK